MVPVVFKVGVKPPIPPEETENQEIVCNGFGVIAVLASRV